jgi:hypothetical protein
MRPGMRPGIQTTLQAFLMLLVQDSQTVGMP